MNHKKSPLWWFVAPVLGNIKTIEDAEKFARPIEEWSSEEIAQVIDDLFKG